MDKNNFVTIIGSSAICAAGKDKKKFFYNTVKQCSPKNCKSIAEYLFETRLDFPAFFLEPKILDKEAEKFIKPFLEKNELENCPNRTIEILLKCLYDLLIDAQIEPKDIKNKTVGIIIGTTVGSTFNNESYYKAYREGEKTYPYAIKNYLLSNLAQVIQSVLEVTGPTMVINNACASGTDALGIASIWIKSGICDIAIAGGADELSKIAYLGFSNLQLTSKYPCKPFDAQRSGLNLGEGAALMLLCPYKKSTQVRGFILGYSCTADAYHPTAPHPEGKGLTNAIKNAIEQAEIKRESIAMINAHGTGTIVNDLSEARAIEAVLDCNIPVVSTKGITGHCLGAAGAIEALWTIEALNSLTCPGTIGLNQKDPKININTIIQGEKISLNSNIGISQSLAFGGSNSCLLLMGKD